MDSLSCSCSTSCAAPSVLPHHCSVPPPVSYLCPHLAILPIPVPLSHFCPSRSPSPVSASGSVLLPCLPLPPPLVCASLFPPPFLSPLSPGSAVPTPCWLEPVSIATTGVVEAGIAPHPMGRYFWHRGFYFIFGVVSCFLSEHRKSAGQRAGKPLLRGYLACGPPSL